MYGININTVFRFVRQMLEKLKNRCSGDDRSGSEVVQDPLPVWSGSGCCMKYNESDYTRREKKKLFCYEYTAIFQVALHNVKSFLKVYYPAISKQGIAVDSSYFSL